MPALPDGEAVPADGALPSFVARHGAHDAGRFGVYVHVPFCSVRCGYCDFNTYTASELGGGASQLAYATTALREVDLAARVLDRAGLGDRPVSTVFFGGGTPTMLPATDLARVLTGVRDAWGLAPDAEVSTEANPDSVTPESLAVLAEAGFTRVSFGMQSAVPHVLATLERTHDPARVPDVVRWAREAGLDVSLDLIYGTPGESTDDWRTSVEAALATGVDHVSAYALVVEAGTKMAAQVRRGEVRLPDEDDQAVKYEIADDLLTAAGLGWYEVSNWSRGPEHACRHNLAYWRGDDWWGIGPGAHSYVGGRAGPDGGAAAGEHAGVRWWNVKHPRRYAAALEAGGSPGAGRELLSRDEAHLERVMLGVRLAEGLDLTVLDAGGRRAVAGLVARELLDGTAAVRGRAVLTRRGRLLADTVVRELTAGVG
ncbi:anaerobic coproporphyrinogen III oxidase [Isoptericola sp. CG 20/1183]|uniref:Heme chaperone HemW n=1 Tax=Isoptericola halotolerans TaxID=300560 RepID=A0ABX5EC34_9MICO|nr:MULTISPECIES: radical SAM family heme chaperone HemW [Isoptericola]MCK0117496.1 radical SAM family heme chaperone HemW [Isoptericola sp. S6320L]PRZ05077.1 anaerobic coproporphyrinogen III oxidase [Isoptericola halotolerans]PRZ05815.1 anaerobic coproporphyrinogen III oxidase [Isoptericola sp. CG 20/1183]